MLSFHAIGKLLVPLTFEFEQANINEVREFKEYHGSTSIYTNLFMEKKNKQTHSLRFDEAIYTSIV